MYNEICLMQTTSAITEQNLLLKEQAERWSLESWIHAST